MNIIKRHIYLILIVAVSALCGCATADNSACSGCLCPMSFGEWRAMDSESRAMSCINPLYAIYWLFE